MVQGLFQDLLGRAADGEGLETYARSCWPEQRVRDSIRGSAEYQQRAAEPEGLRARAVDRVFRELLSRPADQPALAYYTEPLWTEAAIRAEVRGSPEYARLHDPARRTSIDALFLELLGRPADDQALASYGGSGSSEQQVRGNIAGSDEYRSTHQPTR